LAQVAKTFARMALTRTIQVIYTAPQNIVADLITDIQLSNNTRLGTPLAPTITNQGTTGSTTYTYYIVANDAWGGKTLVGPAGQTTTGNATLNSNNYNVITWQPVTGAVSYDILKNGLTTALATGIQGTPNGTNLTCNDQGQATSSYTAPTVNTTGVRAFVTIHHVKQGDTGPTAANKIVSGFEVDPGIPVTLQMNVVLAPGDSIQARVFAGVNQDTAIDGLVSIGLSGVEYS
jgi:hypothetical protein